jgi:hypothetical protein
MFDQLDQYMDRNGFVKIRDRALNKADQDARIEGAQNKLKELFAVYNSEDGSTTAIGDDAINTLVKQIDGTNRFIPAFAPLSEKHQGMAKERWDMWIDHIFQKNPGEDGVHFENLGNSLNDYAQLGTGYAVSKTPLIPQPLGQLFSAMQNAFQKGSSMEDEKVFVDDSTAIVTMFKSVQPMMLTNVITSPEVELSPSSRMLMAMRDEVVQNVCMAINLRDPERCTEAQFDLLKSDASRARQSDNQKKLDQMSHGTLFGASSLYETKNEHKSLKAIRGHLQTAWTSFVQSNYSQALPISAKKNAWS